MYPGLGAREVVTWKCQLTGVNYIYTYICTYTLNKVCTLAKGPGKRWHSKTAILWK